MLQQPTLSANDDESTDEIDQTAVVITIQTHRQHDEDISKSVDCLKAR